MEAVTAHLFCILVVKSFVLLWMLYSASLLLWFLSLGSEMVDWLYSHVEGFVDRRDARRYACNLLKAGFIHHTVNKLTFSEQCYYVFGNNVSKGLNHEDV